QRRRQLADRPHGLEERRSLPIDDAKSDAQCQAANRATRAYQKSKGNPQQNDDWRDEWEGQLLVPLHREPGHVKAGLLEVMDVLAQLAPVHLIVLAHLPVEIAWGFTQLLQRVVLKGNVAGDGRAVKVAQQAGFEQPGVAFRFPLAQVGEDAAAHLKISGVELKHVESAEEVEVRIELLVVVDFEVFSEDPLASRLIEG